MSVNNVVIVDEKIIPADVWEQFCQKVGAQPLTRIKTERSEGETLFYEDLSTRQFKLNLSFVGTQQMFEMNREAFLHYMEHTFHESVTRAMRKAREDLEEIETACARERKLSNEEL